MMGIRIILIGAGVACLALSAFGVGAGRLNLYALGWALVVAGALLV